MQMSGLSINEQFGLHRILSKGTKLGMTEETPKQEPIDAEVVPTPAPLDTPGKVQSKLSTLPPEIIEEMDTRLKSGESITSVRENMIKKYPAVEGLKVGYLAWRKRANKLNGGTTTELKDGTVLKKELVSALPTTEDLKNVVAKVVNPEVSLDDKQAALASLFDKATQRMAILEEKNKQFVNPEYEALLLSYMKEQKSLIEKVTELQEVLQKDLTAQFRGELDELIRVVLSTVYSSYKIEHPDSEPTSKFDGFRTTLENHLSQTLKAYKSQSKP